MAYVWREAKSYDDLLCSGRCIYGIVTHGSAVGVWLSAVLDHTDNPVVHADKILTKTATLNGSRIFFTCLPSDHAEAFVEIKEELKRDLERHVRALAGR